MPIQDVLSKLKKNFDIVMIGLDNSGKTTIMNYLQAGEAGNTIPTTGIDAKEFCLADKVKFKIIDTAGQKQYRGIWVNLIMTTDVIIFVLDIGDTKRYAEAKDEFEKIVKKLRSRKNGNKVPIMFVMNKIDLLKSPKLIEAKKSELFKFFFIQDFLEARNPYQIQPTCALTGDGLFDMVKWIFTTTTTKKVETELIFNEVMLFENEKLVISKAMFLNKDINLFIPGLMDIIQNNIKQLSVAEFKIETKDKYVLFFHKQTITGVAVISKVMDEIRAKTILHSIVEKSFTFNFQAMDLTGRKKVYNQIVIPQITESQSEKDFIAQQCSDGIN